MKEKKVKTGAKRDGMFTFIPGQHKPKPIRNGLIFFAIVFALLFMGYTKDVPLLNEGAFELEAHVENSANIYSGNQVRVRGVQVGKVTGVERDASGEGAIVKMDITDDDVKIKKDARANVYWRTLLAGNFYMEIDPGSRSAAEMEDGGRIPIERTDTQVELDQLNTTLDDPGREGVRTFFREFQKGFDGESAGKAIDRVGPAMEELAPSMRALRGVEPGKDIPDLARGASRTLGALARSEDDLAGLITSANTALAVTAARRQDIGSMLDQAPATFDDTRTTLARLRTTLDILDPVADKLRPGVARLDATVNRVRPTMRTLTQFVPDAMPVLRDADPAVRRLQTASRKGAPLVRELAPTLDRLTKEINPWLESRNPHSGLKTSWGIGPFFAAIGNSAGNFDANGFTQNFDTLNGLGDQISGAIDCAKFGAGAAACELLIGALGKALGAGNSVQQAP